jgi:hypothetical protein
MDSVVSSFGLLGDAEIGNTSELFIFPKMELIAVPDG